MIRRSFAFPHTGLSRLLRDRFVRKQTKPNLATAFHETRHSNTACLNLPVGDVAAFQHLQSVVTEGELGTPPGLTGHAPALLLAVLNFFRHQHKISSQFSVLSRQ